MPNINIELTKDEFERVKRYKPKDYSWKRYIFSAGWVLARLKGEPSREWHESWEREGLKEKPCRKAGACPYGQMVEMFPFREPRDEISCRVFGHSCPAFWMSEPFVDNLPDLTGEEVPCEDEEHPVLPIEE